MSVMRAADSTGLPSRFPGLKRALAAARSAAASRSGKPLPETTETRLARRGYGHGEDHGALFAAAARADGVDGADGAFQRGVGVDVA